ncbi:hypothetical protein F8388_026300 [Cannabis sativa]|uniref:Uncharacterized protein n=1 Tax=Cannabis sativa TaxID=3483 RepID=A0A7J6E4F2_CANSA|nr:hypothetical protein F8388_026300 [Cannabis sativa]
MELQRKKVDEKKKEILVDKTSGLTKNYDDFIATLSENICSFDQVSLTARTCLKMPHPKSGVEKSWKASTIKFMLLIQQRWILK